MDENNDDGAKQIPETRHDHEVTETDARQQTSPTSLESVVGVNNVDKVMQAALGVWDTFISRYPDSMFNKKLIHNNYGLLRRIIDVVVPGTLARVAELEHDIEALESDCLSVQYKALADILSLAGLIPITVSLVETHDQFARAMDKISSYPFLGIYDDSVGVEDSCIHVVGSTQRLLNPLWLVCATFPNESLSPHLVEHNVYSRMVPDSSKIVRVDFDASPLMLESEAVSKLLDELDFGPTTKQDDE